MTITIKEVKYYEEDIFSSKKQKYSLKIMSDTASIETSQFHIDQPVNETYKLLYRTIMM